MSDAEYIASIADSYKNQQGPELQAHYARLMCISAALAATSAQVEADAKAAAQWRDHVGKLEALIAYCPTCCQGFIAQKDMTRDQIIFECGRTAGRAAQPAAQEGERKRWTEIGRAVERACMELPEGAEVILSLERDAGTVKWFDGDGNEFDTESHEDGLSGVMNSAIDAAIAAQQGDKT